MNNILIGSKFDRLKIISIEGKDRKRNIIVKCRCVCGNEKILPFYRIKNKKTRSCGCLQKEILAKRNRSNVAELKNRNFFNKINSEQSAYFLGFMMADGCVSRNGRFRFGLKNTKDNFNIIKNFLKFLKAKNKIHTSHYYKIFKNKKKYFSTVSIEITSKNLVEDLIKHGCVPKKSLILRFPKTVPKKFINHFIRGYFDGDGHIGFYKDKKNRTSSTFSLAGTKYFLKECQKFFIKNGLTKTRLYRVRNIYTMNYGGRLNCKYIYGILYKNANLFLKRKKKIFTDGIKDA